jgi:hypothetical protein
MKRLHLSQMVIGGVQCALCGIEARALESRRLQRLAGDGAPLVASLA